MKKILILLLIILSFYIFLIYVNNANYVEESAINYEKENFEKEKLEVVRLNEIKGESYEYTIEDIKQTFYYNTIYDVDYISSYITIGNINYIIGNTLYNKQDNALLKSNLQLVKADLGYPKIYKFTEVIGAAYAKTTYLQVKNQIPEIVISMDGFTYDKDIDNDKKAETISEYGSPGMQTTLYKWDFRNESVSYVYLNKTVFNDSPSVYIDENSQIVAYIDGKEEYFFIENGNLYRITK